MDGRGRAGETEVAMVERATCLSMMININTRSRLFGYARHLRGRVVYKLLGDDSDSLVDCEHHLWKLAVALSSALFKKYEIWSSLTVVFLVLFG